MAEKVSSTGPDPSFLARSGKNGHGSEALQLWVQQLILTHALKKFIKMGGIPNSALANKNEINSAAANIMKLILFSSTFAKLSSLTPFRLFPQLYSIYIEYIACIWLI